VNTGGKMAKQQALCFAIFLFPIIFLKKDLVATKSGLSLRSAFEKSRSS